jgi:hypothetical protein
MQDFGRNTWRNRPLRKNIPPPWQGNYTDRATAACRRSQCQPLRVEGVAWSAQRIPTAVNLGFLDRRINICRQKDKVKMKLRYMWWLFMDWLHVDQDTDQWRALANKVTNLWAVRNVWKFLSSWATGGFSKRIQHWLIGCLVNNELEKMQKTFVAEIKVFFRYLPRGNNRRQDNR